MAELYGKSFLSVHGACWNDSWASVILKYEPNQIVIAIERLKSSGKHKRYPLNSMEFEDFLKPRQEHASHKLFLPSPKKSEEDISRNQVKMNKLLESLGMKSKRPGEIS